jgi:hypothetical protein
MKAPLTVVLPGLSFTSSRLPSDFLDLRKQRSAIDFLASELLKHGLKELGRK